MSHEELMEAVAAEEAAGGEVGCGLPYRSFLYVSTEDLENFLQRYLADMLAERDIYDIAYRVVCFVERFGIKTKAWQKDNEAIELGKSLEYVPNEQLQQFLVSQLGEEVGQESIERIAHFAQTAIQKTASRPRHTWPAPIWVLKTSTRLYIAQAQTPEDAFARVKEQYPNETEEPQLIQAGGVLAPDQVLAMSLPIK